MASNVIQPAERVEIFNSRQDGDGRCSCWGLAVGHGLLIVTDRLNHNVKAFDQNDFTLRFMLTDVKEPRDISISTNGEIFITDHEIRGVVKYDTAGHLINTYTDVYKQQGYVTCHNNQLIVADKQGGRVMITDCDLNISRQIITAHSLGLGRREFSPCYICVDENSGHLVVGQEQPTSCVYVIDQFTEPKPAVINAFSVIGPRGVCVDQFGHILVAEHVMHRIRLLPSAARRADEPQITVRDDVSLPTAICISAPGRVAVLESEGQVKIFKYLDI